jgi:hypothetical protein
MVDKDLTRYSNISITRLSLLTPGQEEAIVQFISLFI